MDDSCSERKVKIIVAETRQRGVERARQEGLDLGPRGVKIISTSASDGSMARGLRLYPEEVLWDEDYWRGRYSEDVQIALRLSTRV